MSDIFDDERKRRIAGRAQTLFERLETPEAFTYGSYDESSAEALETWRETFPSEAAFEARLEQLGVTKAECKRAACVTALSPDEELPAWLDRLEELVAAVESSDPAAVGPESMIADETDERVFGELTAALASHVCERIATDSASDVLSERAIDSIGEWFRRRFESRFTRMLYTEFKSFVAVHDRELAFADPDEFEDPPTEYYEQFVESLFSSRFSELCVEYPVFARLLTTLTRQLREYVAEFCDRVRADRKRLAERFDADGELGAVADVEPLAADTHGDGRAITRVRFESGLTVAYKPRSVEAGAAFYDVIDRLNSRLPVADLRTPTYLASDGYGWMEWLSYDECEDESAVERYYRRSGALVCIAYLLHFSDCHVENLLVAGEHPVFVDAETVFHPFLGPERQPERTGSRALVEQSVLLTQLVPFAIEQPSGGEGDGTTEVTAGLATSSDEATISGAERPKITEPNTDVLTVEHEPASIDREENVPAVDGIDQPPAASLDALLDGFERTYETILDLRDEGRLGDALGLSEEFASVENRVVYRPTTEYMQVLRSLTSRRCLQDGARFGVEMEQLAVPFCTDYVSDPPWQLYDAEREALRRFDPPRFTAETDSTALDAHGRRLDVEADESGVDRARQRLANASRKDLREQTEYIRGCFGVRPAPDDGTASPAADEPTLASDERLREEAHALLDEIRDVALEADDGTHYWASPASWTDGDRFTVRPVDESLAVGRCGIALLGAGLYRLTGVSEYRQFALDTVRPVRASIDAAYDPPSLTSPGGMDGLGSVAYGLAVVGDLADADSLLDDAVRVADLLADDTLAADDTYDVSHGGAGTVLGLLGAADRTGADELVSAAERCGDHLLANRTTTEDGVPVWKTIGDVPLTGFAHGTAGIAYALVRLSAATGERAYREIALNALEFETDAFSETEQNWPDRRAWSAETYPDRWCHGRSGIGLARLGTAAYVDDERVESGFDRAVEGVSATVGRMDHLCCGNAGRAEFLLAADQRRGREQGTARELLSRILRRKAKEGSYRTLSATHAITDPTLFYGSAGIGYTMLRATAPDTLPSVLLWE